MYIYAFALLESIEELWEQFKLFDEETAMINLNEGVIDVVQKKRETCLIGKICMEHQISWSIKSFTMANIWRASKLAIYILGGWGEHFHYCLR